MKRNYTHISRILSATLMLFLISAVALIAQAPVTFNYQALLRDTEGDPRANASVSLELQIHQGTITGTIVYSETHNTTTNEFGIVNLALGSVNPGSFEVVDWSAGPYFAEVSVDGTSMGTSELLAVPYARHAGFAESVDMAVVNAATAGWDKNEADDFDGVFGSLSGIPAGLSDGDDNTQLNEGQVEAFIDGDETSFNGWDKDASDDITGLTNIQHYFQFATFRAGYANPIAFGFIEEDGTIASGSGNFTCSWDATPGRYVITITGHSYFWTSFTTVVTLAQASGEPAIVATDSLGGSLLVSIRQ